MKVISLDELGDLSHLVGFKRRKINNPDEWGDSQTITAAVKRKGKSFDELDLEKDFGIFLGGNLVGIVDIARHIVYAEKFDSLDEMKSQWEID